MFCNLKISHPYYSVILKDFKQEERYVFIGEQYRNPVLKRIANKQKISSSEIKGLCDKLKIDHETYKSAYNWDKYEHPITFVKYRVRVDDTIENLRYKIMISTQTENRLIIPANQQLYTKSGRVIGIYFNVKGDQVTAITDPKNKFKIDKKFVTTEGFRRTENKSNLVNHIHYLIMDELDIYNKKEFNIYCTSLHSVLERLQSKKIKIDKKVKNGYLYKYFPK